MICAYFDVKPRKAASVAVRPVPSPVIDVFKPAQGKLSSGARAVVTGSPQAVTAGLHMHAEFRALPDSPVAAGDGYASDGWMDAPEDDDDVPDDDGLETPSDYLDEDSLTDDATGPTSVVADDADAPLDAADDADLLLDAAVDAHFFARRKQRVVDVDIVFSGPMLCCEEEDFD